MAGIEFLEPTEPTERSGAADPTGDARTPVPPDRGKSDPPTPGVTPLWWLAAALWSAAAVLAVTAAYLPVLGISYAGGPGSYTVNAWGRYSGGGAAEAVLHGARYGPVLCAVGVVLAGLAASCALRAGRRPSDALRVVLGVVTYVSVGFLAGLAVAMVLQITGVLDSELATVHRVAGLGDPVNADLTTTIGASVGFVMASLACAALAAAAGNPVVHRLASAPRGLRRSRG